MKALPVREGTKLSVTHSSQLFILGSVVRWRTPFPLFISMAMIPRGKWTMISTFRQWTGPLLLDSHIVFSHLCLRQHQLHIQHLQIQQEQRQEVSRNPHTLECSIIAKKSFLFSPVSIVSKIIYINLMIHDAFQDLGLEIQRLKFTHPWPQTGLLLPSTCFLICSHQPKIHKMA